MVFECYLLVLVEVNTIIYQVLYQKGRRKVPYNSIRVDVRDCLLSTYYTVANSSTLPDKPRGFQLTVYVCNSVASLVSCTFFFVFKKESMMQSLVP